MSVKAHGPQGLYISGIIKASNIHLTGPCEFKHFTSFASLTYHIETHTTSCSVPSHDGSDISAETMATADELRVLMHQPLKRWTDTHLDALKVAVNLNCRTGQVFDASYLPADGDDGMSLLSI